MVYNTSNVVQYNQSVFVFFFLWLQHVYLLIHVWTILDCDGCELIFFSPVKILPGWSVHLPHFIHLWVFPAPLPPSVLLPWWQWGWSGLACGPNTFYGEPHFISSQEQSRTLRMVSLSSVSRPEISLLALIQALNLLLARNFQSLGGVTLCLSWQLVSLWI